jgi:hypothetical protein
VDLLHLEGKRQRDIVSDKADRRELKRKDRREAISPEAKRRKDEAEKKKEANLKKYSSLFSVAKLCNGQEKCCNGRCLEV